MDQPTELDCLTRCLIPFSEWNLEERRSQLEGEIKSNLKEPESGHVLSLMREVHYLTLGR